MASAFKRQVQPQSKLQLGHKILGNWERRWSICHHLATVSLRLFWALGLHGCKPLLGSFGKDGILAYINPVRPHWSFVPASIESDFEMSRLGLTCASLPLADLPLAGLLGPGEAIDFSQASQKVLQEEHYEVTQVKFLTNSGEDSLGRVDVCALGLFNLFLEVLPLLLPNSMEEILESLNDR